MNGSSTGRRLVLLVEDNPGDADLATAYLEELSPHTIEVRHAGSVGEAISTLADSVVDAVLLDLNLPDSNGVETLIRVRAAAGGASIIVLSGAITEDLRALALDSGADDVLGKDQSTNGLFARNVLHLIERDLAQKHQRDLERLLEANPDAMVVVGADKTIKSVNAAALRLFEKERSALIDGRFEFDADVHVATELIVPGIRGPRTCEVRTAAFEWRGEPAFLASIRDLSEIKRALRNEADARKLASDRAEQLQIAEGIARNHALRLQALWRASDRAREPGIGSVRAILNEVEIAMRPGRLFRPLLSRIDPTGSYVLAVGGANGEEEALFPEPGLRVGLEEGILPLFERSWFCNDVKAMPRPPTAFRTFPIRAAIATKFKAGSENYLLILGSSESTVSDPFAEDDVEYVEILASIFARLLDVQYLEGSLQLEQQRTNLHARRLESLLRIVNDASLNDSERWIAMLEHAATSILPGQHYRAVLSRVAGESIVQEAIADSERRAFSTEGDAATPQAFPLAGTFAELVFNSTEQTLWWDDFEAVPALPQAIGRGWRAGMATSFYAIGNRWLLSFLSHEPARRPFGDHERTYVELLASFVASHLQHNWQFERLQHQQAHDLLTGLLNRSQFRSRARSASRDQSDFAVLKIDISNFGEINAAYGQMIGDALLVEVANALSRALEPLELLGRVAGDVFGVFIPHYVSKQAVRARTDALLGVFSRPFSTGDREGKEFVALTASVGVALSQRGEQFDLVTSHADSALAATKRRGHGTMLFYEPGMEGDPSFNATLRNELVEAINAQQFELYFQPHVDMQTGKVLGAEALIRWNHPERGIVLPAAFIPFAERSGMIVAIDSWVMSQSFAAAAVFARTRPNFRLYFNLSGRQAGSPDIVRAFSDAAFSGKSLVNIGVEITESDAMRDVIETRQVCQHLRQLGVHVAIDDFGTGYSSLSSLKQLPVDMVKIDRSFVAGVLTDQHDVAITQAIIEITRRFDFVSLAEGVESPEQLVWLRDHGCSIAQGFGICKPLPLGAFNDWLTLQRD